MVNKLKNFNIYFIVISIMIILLISIPLIKNNYKKQDTTVENIKLPDGFKIDAFASGLGGSFFAAPGPNKGPRLMEFYKDVLFASIPSAGLIVALPDKNKDGKADEVIKVIEGLNRPHGIAFKDDYMYVANEDSIVKIRLKDDLTADKSTIEQITDLPSGGHWNTFWGATDIPGC